eukprot:TRINITY_DN3880_c1_g1_i5.p1 TRINITY_DN3880_c1_g1~~TRINITY_DN3880_c1_g1_i5.p1  ORF type:complete len:426 (+),score=91.71 TRINITY_DN3880_c1_g1_i5:333-1610(+)
MGTYLSTPKTEKEVEEDSNEHFEYGMSAMQGWRVNMEDAHLGNLNPTDKPGDGFFGVFDGHGGKEVAIFCAKYMRDVFVNQQSFQSGNIEQALKATFLRMDQLLVLPQYQDELKQWQSQNSDDEGRTEFQFSVLPPDVREAIRENIGVVEGAKLVLTTESGEKEGEDDLGVEMRGESGDEEGDEGGDVNGAVTGSVGENQSAESSRSGKEDDGKQVSTAQQDDENMSTEQMDGVSISGAGCTSVVAFVQGTTLWVANAGDSRCVLCRNGNAVAMTEDHKPTDPPENERIINAGGYVTEGRVNGTLNLSRAIGDLEYKQVKSLGPEAQMVTCLPDVESISLQQGDEFMVLACDGIWEVLDNQTVVDFVREKLQMGMRPQYICEALCDVCLAPEVDSMGKGCDNMSVMVILFKNFCSTLNVNSEVKE